MSMSMKYVILLITGCALLTLGGCEDRSEEIAALQSEIEQLKSEVDELKNKVSTAGIALDALTSDFGTLEQNIEDLSSTVDDLESSIGDFGSGVPWRDVVSDVEVHSLEVSSDRDSVKRSTDEVKTSIESVGAALQ